MAGLPGGGDVTVVAAGPGDSLIALPALATALEDWAGSLEKLRLLDFYAPGLRDARRRSASLKALPIAETARAMGDADADKMPVTFVEESLTTTDATGDVGSGHGGVGVIDSGRRSPGEGVLGGGDGTTGLAALAEEGGALDGDLISELASYMSPERVFEHSGDMNAMLALWGGSPPNGDLLQLQADAIVVPANARLNGSGMGLYAQAVAGAGPELEEELLAVGSTVQFGRAVATGGYMLNANTLVHAIAPKSESDCATLQSCYLAALAAAIERGARTVGFPLLGSGESGMPPAKAATAGIASLRHWMEQDGNMERLDRIVICAHDAREHEILEQVLKRFFPAPGPDLSTIELPDAPSNPPKPARPATVIPE